jgi:hypothetical protein
MRNKVRAVLSFICFAAATTPVIAFAADCISPNAAVANGVNLHAEPRTASAKLGTLGARRVIFMGDAEAGGRASPATAPSANSIEGKLLQCCAQDLFADALIVGHHGRKTSSRSAFLDAVGASFYVSSSGPKKYASVTLPDSAIIQTVVARRQVFRTDMSDAQCASGLYQLIVY